MRRHRLSRISAQCGTDDQHQYNMQHYPDRLAWQAEQFPDSLASEIVNGAATYADDTAKTVYIGTLYVTQQRRMAALCHSELYPRRTGR